MTNLPPAILTLPVAVVGLVMGSFVTALSYRLPRGESVARGRSRCPSCGHVLGVRDLVPVVSWLAYRGSCRHCGARVSARYPAIELTTMTLFAAGPWLVSDPWRLVLFALMTVTMVALAVIDLEEQRLPNGMLFALLAASLTWRWALDGNLVNGVAASAVIFASGLLLNAGFRGLVGHSGLGLGDLKLLGVCAVGLPLGPLLLFLCGAGLLGVAFGTFWYWRRGATVFPFGPPVLMACWLTLAAGGQAFDLLLSHLGLGLS